MSAYYYLLCLDCKTGIHLGKTVYTQYEDIDQQTLGFDQLGYSGDKVD